MAWAPHTQAQEAQDTLEAVPCPSGPLLRNIPAEQHGIRVQDPYAGPHHF